MTTLVQTLLGQPDEPSHYCALAISFEAQQRWEEAFVAFQAALTLAQENFQAGTGIRRCLVEFSSRDDSLKVFASDDVPLPEGLNGLSDLAQRLARVGLLLAASGCLRRAAAIYPDNFDAMHRFSQSLLMLKQWDEALQCLEAACERWPDRTEFHLRRGIVLGAMGRDEEAQAAFDRALYLTPNFGPIFGAIGGTLIDRGKVRAALAWLQSAERALPDDPDVRLAFALALNHNGQHDAALAQVAKLIQQDPDISAYKVQQGLLLLGAGVIAEGFLNLEFRVGAAGNFPLLATPELRWLGDEPLTGLALCVLADGDDAETFVLARFLPPLVERFAPASVCLLVTGHLVDVLRRALPTIDIRPRDQIVSFDRITPLFSLPHLLDVAGLDLMPAALHVSDGAKPGPQSSHRLRRIGIAWRPGTPGSSRANAPTLADLLDTIPPGWKAVALHPRLALSEQALADRLEWPLEDDHGPTSVRLIELMLQLDAIVTVPGFPALLASLFGLSHWVLVPTVHDWFYLHDGGHSPWLPGAQLLRQQLSGDWRAPLITLHQALAADTSDPHGKTSNAHTPAVSLADQPGLSPAPNVLTDLATSAWTMLVRGDLTTAKAGYEALLAQAPGNAEGLHGLGMLAHRQGQNQTAINLLEQAVTSDPGNPRLLYHLGRVYRKTGERERAIACFARASALDGLHWEALASMGVALREAGRLEDALHAYSRVVQIRPEYTDAHVNIGNCLYLTGKPTEAIGAYQSALTLEPGNQRALDGLTAAIAALGERQPLFAELAQKVPRLPDALDIQESLGELLAGLGEYKAALATFRRVLARDPNRISALENLTGCLVALKEWRGTAEMARAALVTHPASPRLNQYLGAALNKLGDLEGAVRHLQLALEATPKNAECWNTLATVHQDRGAYVAAEEALRRAIAIEPDNVSYQGNMGLALIGQGRFDESINCFRHALVLEPDNPTILYNRAFPNFLLGRWTEGWADYEARFKGSGLWKPQDFERRVPRWQGETLAGRRVLLQCEQGFGDSIQFIRYLPHLLATNPHKVILEIQRDLRHVLPELDPRVQMIVQGEPRPDFDVFISMLSMAHWCGTTPTTVPATIPYLSVRPDRLKYWREQLDQWKGSRIGIVWAGNPDHRRDHERSVPLSTLAPILAVPGAHFFALQKGTPARQMLDHPDSGLIALAERIQDFADTAAIIECLDLVISVDTSVAHLAGALGRPVWTLLTWVPDWRWQMHGESTPWYPSMTLYRQSEPLVWEDVVARVAQELPQFIRATRQTTDQQGVRQ